MQLALSALLDVLVHVNSHFWPIIIFIKFVQRFFDAEVSSCSRIVALMQRLFSFDARDYEFPALEIFSESRF